VQLPPKNLDMGTPLPGFLDLSNALRDWTPNVVPVPAILANVSKAKVFYAVIVSLTVDVVDNSADWRKFPVDKQPGKTMGQVVPPIDPNDTVSSPVSNRSASDSPGLFPD